MMPPHLPRSFGFSLLCDAGVFGVAQVAGMPPYVTVAVWASAWPTMLLHTRALHA